MIPKICLSLLVNFFVFHCFAQFTYKIKADSVKITNDSCTAELIIENSTKNIQGFLYNRGIGRTEFKKALTKVNDSVYIIGEDTLKLSSETPLNAWKLTGNSVTNPSVNFLGTTDSIHLVFRTFNTERARLLANGNFLIGGTTDNGYKLDVTGSFQASSNSKVNGLNIGKGGSNIATNTAFGYNSLNANTIGVQNTAVGYNSLAVHTTGYGNTAVGYNTLSANTTGIQNSAFGRNVLSNNTTGEANIGVGVYALYTNTTGTSNTAVGFNSLYANTTGYFNSAFGNYTLSSNTTGYINMAIGARSLENNTTGAANVAIGFYALNENISGSNNIGIGQNALKANTTGHYNSAIGTNTLAANTTGTQNMASGFGALFSSTTASYNTAIGSRALYYTTTGENNTVIGYDGLRLNTTGGSNVAIGTYAGSTLTEGNSNIFIGTSVQPNISTTSSNQLNIGNWIYGNNGKIGVGVSSPTGKLAIAAGTATANTAPLKFTAGTNMSTPEAGAVEFDGSNYFASSSTIRYTLAKTLTTTSSLNFGSTAAGTSTDLTITLTGVESGDAVSLGVPNASVSSNGIFSAWVSATNTVTIRFSNNDLTNAIDPASGTFRVSVIKY